MKVLTMINIKGGVGKTTTAIAVAAILAQEYRQRVLVVDLDKQHSTTAALGVFNPALTSAELLVERSQIIDETITHTASGIDLIPASFSLLAANRHLLMDASRPQQLRLKKQIESVRDNYDYCVIDCPPDLDIAVTNALAITDDVIIPMDCSEFSTDGLKYIFEIIDDVSLYSPNLRLGGCLLTMNIRQSNIAAIAREKLDSMGLPVFQQTIRHSASVRKATYADNYITSLLRSSAADDYRAFVAELTAEDSKCKLVS